MESTLNLSVTDLTGEVGSFLGWGRNADRWSVDKAKDVRECVASCLRKFYFQAQLRPDDGAHNWTFLKPVATIQIEADVDTAQLPSDFAGFEGLATVSSSSATSGFWPLQQVHEEQIRVRYAASGSITGRPQAFAERQKKSPPNELRSNRSEFYVFPRPDAAYTVSVAYFIAPEYLTVHNPWPYGGPAHAETMKAGARSAAELFMDATPGPETANYMQCLAASIAHDRRHQPKTLGINTDRSDWGAEGRGRWPKGLWEPLGIGYLQPGPSIYI